MKPITIKLTTDTARFLYTLLQLCLEADQLPFLTNVLSGQERDQLFEVYDDLAIQISTTDA